MIRKKKVIKVQNPISHAKDFFELYQFEWVTSVILFGTLEDLASLIQVYNQGEWCEDCGGDYETCDCEYCEECDQQRCLCAIEDLGINDRNAKNRNKIRKIGWEFVRFLNFEEKDLKKFIIPQQYVLQSLYEEGEITLQEVKFLKSLTPESKFPEYTPMMKRIFGID